MTDRAVLRVLMIVSSFYPKLGGAEKQVRLLASALKRHRIDATILTRRYPGMPKLEELDGVKVIRLGIHRPDKFGSCISAVSWLSYGWKHRLDYDLFHAHQPFSSAWVAAVLGKLTGKPSLCKVPCTHSAIFLDSLKGRLLANLLNAMVVVNEESYRLLENKNYNCRLHRIPNGIEVLSKFLETKNDHNSIIVLYVGRIERDKGVETLLLAWPKVAREFPKAQLLIVGDGSETRRLKILSESLKIKTSVHFVGSVNPNNIFFFYHNATCFVKPSFNEGISNSLLEAMIQGVPVIASRIYGNTDILVEDETGLFFEPGNPKSLAKAITSTLYEFSEAKARASRAYEHVIANYNIDHISVRYAELYRELLQQKPK